MPIARGDRAPGFRLRGTDNEYWILGEPDRRRSVLVSFFRREAGACRLMLPFIERLHRRGHQRPSEILGISLDNQRDTLEFAEDYTLTFPILIETPDLATVRDYRVEGVPTLYRLDERLRVADVMVGWSREGFEPMARAYLDAIDARLRDPWEAGEKPPERVPASPVPRMSEGMRDAGGSP